MIISCSFAFSFLCSSTTFSSRMLFSFWNRLSSTSICWKVTNVASSGVSITDSVELSTLWQYFTNELCFNNAYSCFHICTLTCVFCSCISFLRDALQASEVHATAILFVRLSVRPSVTLCVLLKRLNISSNFFTTVHRRETSTVDVRRDLGTDTQARTEGAHRLETLPFRVTTS